MTRHGRLLAALLAVGCWAGLVSGATSWSKPFRGFVSNYNRGVLLGAVADARSVTYSNLRMEGGWVLLTNGVVQEDTNFAATASEKRWLLGHCSSAVRMIQFKTVVSEGYAWVKILAAGYKADTACTEDLSGVSLSTLWSTRTTAQVALSATATGYGVKDGSFTVQVPSDEVLSAVPASGNLGTGTPGQSLGSCSDAREVHILGGTTSGAAFVGSHWIPAVVDSGTTATESQKNFFFVFPTVEHIKMIKAVVTVSDGEAYLRLDSAGYVNDGAGINRLSESYVQTKWGAKISNTVATTPTANAYGVANVLAYTPVVTTGCGSCMNQYGFLFNS